MKLYRTTNGKWVGTQADWKEAQREEGNDAAGTPTAVEVPTNPKADLIDFLNQLGGAPAPAPAPAEPATTVPTIIHADGPLDLDEMVKKAPMKQRLAWAVETIDDAEGMMDKMVTALKAKAGVT